jgi:hypothetical protein
LVISLERVHKNACDWCHTVYFMRVV